MNIKIDIALCRVCLKQGAGTNIHTGNILEKFQFTTLVQVSKHKILLLHNQNLLFFCAFLSFSSNSRYIENNFIIWVQTIRSVRNSLELCLPKQLFHVIDGESHGKLEIIERK